MNDLELTDYLHRIDELATRCELERALPWSEQNPDGYFELDFQDNEGFDVSFD